MDIQPKEKEAATKAGEKGGEYLESINKFDLSTLTKEEWQTFLEVVCIDYHMNLVIPF